MSDERASVDVDLAERRREAGGLPAAATSAYRRTRQSVRDSVPERFRAGFARTRRTLGVVLALAVVAVSAYVVLDTAFLAVAPLLGMPVQGLEYTVAVRILGFVVLALSWDLVGGQMGYASFGNMAFFGVGVYVTVVLLNGTVEAVGTQPFVVALAAAGLVSLVYGLAIGLPLLRLRGHYFAVATLGVLVATQQYVANLEQTGAGAGMTVSQAGFGDVDRTFYLLFLALAAATATTYWYLTRTRFGYGLNAIRDDEGKARASGLDTTKYKIVAWGVAALFTGLAGSLFAVHNAFVDPRVAFNVDWTVFMILMVLVGGAGRLWGPVLGAAFLWTLRDTLWSNPPVVQRASEITGVPFSEAYLVVFGALLVVTVLAVPQGVLGYLAARGAFGPFRRAVERTPLSRLLGPSREVGD